ncbi:MAG: hypothetical protein HY712_01915 [candidate division NC10 bacterium]|nr:hypothetical protein [candidate division NC10 bacterium]
MRSIEPRPLRPATPLPDRPPTGTGGGKLHFRAREVADRLHLTRHLATDRSPANPVTCFTEGASQIAVAGGSPLQGGLE